MYLPFCTSKSYFCRSWTN